ncbi:MAG: ribbon-helix-helix protein, CopG family [Candidatus Pacebacteria bacterium]|nr:ribbon-helix-helix protein, CopG family [Candidatus Paceibacterota bacterium]
MRTVLNISMPKSMAKKIEQETKRGSFASKSEFIRSVFRFWEEQLLLQELDKSQKEMEEGKGIILKSLKDLR